MSTLKNQSFLQGIFFLILAQIMVGFNLVFSKFLISSFPLLFMLAMRFALAALILFPLHWLSGAGKRPLRSYLAELNKKDWIFIFAQALTAGVLFNSLMLLGLNYTDANIAGIITAALPAIIALMSWLFLKEKISTKMGLCILLATFGLLVIALAKVKGLGLSHSFLGDFFVLLSLLPEASYYVLTKFYNPRLPVFLISALLNFINALILIPFIFIYSIGSMHITLSNWIILLILGLSSGLFYVFWCFGAQKVEGVSASLTTAVMPVATVALAWLILGEHLSGLECLGMGLVILSIAISAWRG